MKVDEIHEVFQSIRNQAARVASEVLVEVEKVRLAEPHLSEDGRAALAQIEESVDAMERLVPDPVIIEGVPPEKPVAVEKKLVHVKKHR